MDIELLKDELDTWSHSGRQGVVEEATALLSQAFNKIYKQ